MARTGTEWDKIRRELEKSYDIEYVNKFMAFWDVLPRASKETAEESGFCIGTDWNKIQRELEKSYSSERVSKFMALRYTLPRAPKKTAQDSGFYEAMTHGVSNHVVWGERDLVRLLKAVPAGSVGCPVVGRVRGPTIPLCFRENKVRVIDFGHLHHPIEDVDAEYLRQNYRSLSKLSFTAKNDEQLKMVQKMANLRELSIRICEEDFAVRADPRGPRLIPQQQQAQIAFMQQLREMGPQKFMQKLQLQMQQQRMTPQLQQQLLQQAHFRMNFQHQAQRAAMTTFRCCWSNVARLDFYGHYVVNIYWEVPPVNLTHLALRNVRQISQFDWLPQSTKLVSITLENCNDIFLGSLVLPDSLTEVYVDGVSNITSLECGRSARSVLVRNCSGLDSICFRKALALDELTLDRLCRLERVETPRHLPSLDARFIQYLKNFSSSVRWSRYIPGDWKANSLESDSDEDHDMP